MTNCSTAVVIGHQGTYRKLLTALKNPGNWGVSKEHSILASVMNRGWEPALISRKYCIRVLNSEQVATFFIDL
jgi:hypothetical protein